MGHIVAMDGGGFSMEPDNPLLDEYLLDLSRRAHPRVSFVPTAGGDSDDDVRRFHDAFSERAETSHLSLFRPDGRAPGLAGRAVGRAAGGQHAHRTP